MRVKEHARIKECRQPWSYANIGDQRFEITVLYYYSKRVNGETNYPNFLIGITANGDTIGILDKYYSSALSKDDKVVVVGGDWEVDDQIFDYAMYQYSLNPKENDLFCKINLVLRGRILFKKD